MAVSRDFFLDGNADRYVFETTADNKVEVFYDNKAYFASVLRDVATADREDDFIYFVNWWADIHIPLGDPKANPIPPSFRGILLSVSSGAPPPLQSSLANLPGPEICCMLWQHKAQTNWSALPGIVLPDSIFGATILSAINTETWKFVNTLRGHNKGILDKAHRAAGSHHQKFVVIKNADNLVAYVGSSDFNADRLYEKGNRSAYYPPTTGGAPLEDVSVRIEGLAAFQVLRTFVDRWSFHANGRDFPLKGAGYVPVTKGGGTVSVQITHTYGKNYPFKNAVRGAADAQLKIARNARQYLYYEDQYLIGTPEIALELRNKLASNVEFVVIGVMAPIAIVADMPWIAERRSEFWRPLAKLYPDRVLLFEMLNAAGSDTGSGAYLHNKMTIADDTVATVGSVNFSQRSWTHDSEIMATIGGTTTSDSGTRHIALEIRINRWARHLAQPRTHLERLPDALGFWRRLPSTAIVRTWTPLPDTMSFDTRGIYTWAYETIFDPA